MAVTITVINAVNTDGAVVSTADSIGLSGQELVDEVLERVGALSLPGVEPPGIEFFS